MGSNSYLGWEGEMGDRRSRIILLMELAVESKVAFHPKILECRPNLCLGEHRGFLVPLIAVLVVYRSVMLVRILAALQDKGHNGKQLSVRVVGIVHVRWSLQGLLAFG
jgi:hypothetical protein